MSGRKLDPGTLPKEARRGRVERHLLALTGGGYRGLFSATVLRKLEHTSVQRLANRFDMIAGTSIGGILAIGLACGVSAGDLAELIREHGASIFKPRWFSMSGLMGSRYGAAGLKTAIIKVLGKQTAKSSFVDIPVPLIVCAVDEMTSQPRLFGRLRRAAAPKTRFQSWTWPWQHRPRRPTFRRTRLRVANMSTEA